MSCPADAHVRPGPSMPPLHRLSFGPAGPPRLVDLPDGTQAWMVSRYADVRKVLTDSRFGRAGLHTADAPSLSGESGLVSSLDLIFNQDGEDHLRLRRHAACLHAEGRRPLAALDRDDRRTVPR